MVADPPTRPTSRFERPADEVQVDVDAHLRSCPTAATTRGTFFQFVADLVEREHRSPAPSPTHGLSRRHWVPWNSYPLADFMRLAVDAARLLHRDRPLGEGLRRLGRMAYPSFAATMAGRVVLYAFGDDIDAMMQAVPRAYAVSLSHAVASSRRIEPRRWEVRMQNVYNFADTYHLGVIEGALVARGVEPDVRLRKCARLCDIDFDVRW